MIGLVVLILIVFGYMGYTIYQGEQEHEKMCDILQANQVDSYYATNGWYKLPLGTLDEEKARKLAGNQTIFISNEFEQECL